MAYKRMTPKPPLLIQMAQAADMLGRTTKAVGKILRDHGAQPRKYGKRWCVPVAEFRRVLLEIQAEEAAAANEVAQPEAGMASKEVMVTAPVVVLLYQYTFLTGSFRRALS